MATKGKEALPVLTKAQDDPYEGVAKASSEGLRGEIVLPQAMEPGGVGQIFVGETRSAAAELDRLLQQPPSPR